MHVELIVRSLLGLFGKIRSSASRKSFPAFVRCQLALIVIGLAFVPRWGYFDYTSSLHPNERDIPFTGLDALRHQTATLCLIGCGVAIVILGMLVVPDLTGKNSMLARMGSWNISFLAVALATSALWLRILQLDLANDRYRIFVSSVWYKDLGVGFWLVPVSLLIASVIVFVPFITEGQAKVVIHRDTDLVPAFETGSQGSKLVNERPDLAGLFFSLLVLFPLLLIIYWVLQ